MEGGKRRRWAGKEAGDDDGSVAQTAPERSIVTSQQETTRKELKPSGHVLSAA
jgi:hypothetical protein